MWKKIFDGLLTRLIVTGRIEVTFPDGTRKTYGKGGALRGSMQVLNDRALRRICLKPELGFAEGYMDRAITFDGSTLEDAMRLAMRNLAKSGKMPLWVRMAERAKFWVRAIKQHNTPLRSRFNVAHHYDISDDLYRLFLDRDMQYSCAYFPDPGTGLDEAQAAKKAHIAAKLRIEPGMRVLDIGCGWGGMALTLARDHGAHVTGVTLSKNQLNTARARAAAAGLEDQTAFRMIDYRELDETFDRIVSVGMLEHVGVPYYGEYFAKVSDLLAPDGVALIHTIGRCGPPAIQSDFLNKYIFPGGYVPSMSELALPIEKAGLWHLDIEILRLHYARTLRHWLERFEGHLDKVRAMYDERFIRMWRFYLVCCILSFEEFNQAVFQFQLGHTRDAAPLTRDYLYRASAPAWQYAAK
ncbi:cyclopropane-fatty-acyl-phospholipid synthase family protein [Vannielia sp.]|uniref:SAM-dependent methyltransferase n=1 Tax=Vannielia sp. TaxID=2813045 RepID=UPI00262B459B|nr:cyclopropane-fatty-acyl-phospholipid synthase family protein [Vannielia sp.]MDF1872180.1 cyclopropane-fatty-acyl-phospholipid synthase [Vannielia sp.]